jgi:thioredoxin-related protein
MKTILMVLAFFISANTFAQQNKIYNPKANATSDIAAAVKLAKANNKFVLIQAGGNWCRWCIEFVRFAKENPKIDSMINANFVWYHLNYSPENKNKNTFAKLGYPERFGFPAFVILNAKGERIHTQNSEYLEDSKKSYDVNKVFEFLSMWIPKAVNFAPVEE